jgi:high-affinity K+ transport system ATPase subunit B
MENKKSKKPIIVAYNQMEYIRELYRARQELIDTLKDMIIFKDPLTILDLILEIFAEIIHVCEDLNDTAMKARYMKELVNFYNRVTINFHQLAEALSYDPKYSVYDDFNKVKSKFHDKFGSTIELFH